MHSGFIKEGVYSGFIKEGVHSGFIKGSIRVVCGSDEHAAPDKLGG